MKEGSMREQPAVPTINAVQKNHDIPITFDQDKPVDPEETEVKNGDTVTWSGSIPKAGKLEIMFSPFHEICFCCSKPHSFKLGPFTVAVHPRCSTKRPYDYQVSFTPEVGVEHVLDPVIIVDATEGGTPMGGGDH